METLSQYQSHWAILGAYAEAGHFIADDGQVVIRHQERWDAEDKRRDQIANHGDC